MKVVMSE
jgi:hypothetical protein